MNFKHGKLTKYSMVRSSGPVQKEWSSSSGGMFSAYFTQMEETAPRATRQNMRLAKEASAAVSLSSSTGGGVLVVLMFVVGEGVYNSVKVELWILFAIAVDTRMDTFWRSLFFGDFSYGLFRDLMSCQVSCWVQSLAIKARYYVLGPAFLLTYREERRNVACWYVSAVGLSLV